VKTLGLVAYPDGDVKLEPVNRPKLGDNRYAPHDVLCEVRYCGICGSGVHRWKVDKTGIKSVPRKVVIGHEIVSVVKDVGVEVTRVKPGDRVGHEIVTSFCSYCKPCREGRYNICLQRTPMDGRTHCVTGGGFTRHAGWPEQQLHRLPNAIGRRRQC
jgi:D-arabinose 1-dehydrogenase-like Zn-dependent alcohol dehydrogenase